VTENTYRRMQGRISVLGLLGAVLFAGPIGCETDSWLDPSVVGRWEHTPVTMPILDRIDVIEPRDTMAVTFSEVTPDDLRPDFSEYTIGPSDVVGVVIFELVDPGQEAAYQRQVDATGLVRLPFVGAIKAAGKTPSQLEDHIARLLERRDIIRDARARTLELVEGLDADQLIGPKLPTVNPLQWEIGHVAWFYEYFILRRIYGRDKILADGDTIYDSIAITHETRWDLPLLSLNDTLDYMAAAQDAVLERLEGDTASVQDSYLYQFTAFHEDMHTEAYTYTRQALGYPEPGFALASSDPEDHTAGALPGDADIPGGKIGRASCRERV